MAQKNLLHGFRKEFMIAEHLEKLVKIGYYVAAPVMEVTPYQIEDGCETVEILTSGKVRFEVDGEERVFTRGTVFWHTAGEMTICRTFADDPYRCIHFRFAVRDNHRPGPRVSIWRNPEETISFCEECREAFHSGNVNLEALGAYAYAVIRWKAAASQLASPEMLPQALRMACQYIERHLGGHFSPETLAHKADISRPYLFALFRKHLGIAPLHYIQERRIARARLLLTAPESHSIKEIAAECGFSDLEVFYRHFKQKTGLTPAAYRKQYSISEPHS